MQALAPKPFRAVLRHDGIAPHDKPPLAEHLVAKRIDDCPNVIRGPAEPQEAASAGGNILTLKSVAVAHGLLDGRANLLRSNELQFLERTWEVGTITNSHAERFVLPEEIIAGDKLACIVAVFACAVKCFSDSIPNPTDPRSVRNSPRGFHPVNRALHRHDLSQKLG